MSLHDDAAKARTGRDDWNATILAGLANYIDSGSIVSGAAALALWTSLYGLSDSLLGLIAAFGPNAIGAGIGALVGGWLCDRFGRKRIYQYDMLLYAAGMTILVFAVAPWMIVLGFVIVGLAVGADIPASWSLIAEEAPADTRGKHSGVAQILWNLGPVVVLLMSLALAGLGELGARLVFAHLVIVALGLTFLRRKMHESRPWTETQSADFVAPPISSLFRRPYLVSILALVGIYGFWNLWAGTNGLFFPYLMETLGVATRAQSIALQCLNFALGMLANYLVFMKLVDRVSHRAMFLISAIAQVVGMSLLALLPLNVPVVLAHVVILGFFQGFGAQSFFQLWSAEMFPTALRSTAQGLCFAIVRIGLGLFSLFVPFLASADFAVLAWILTGFLALSALVGWLWAPDNAGKSLEQIEREQRVGLR
ncbi:MFS transporter [Sphingopyxis sp. MWB1]|uniref:MFS transporter n=1 Tax=Sphingopyxis sp. MWB1 TaxID=1537715 RepID=UPI000AB2AFD8|nr:MFS transporter [Sphingopyxis sp. MWB1]